MKFGALLMPSHPPERSIGDGQQRDLADLKRLDALEFEEAWIGEHFTASWEPCPAPEPVDRSGTLANKADKAGALGSPASVITIPSEQLTGWRIWIIWLKGDINSAWVLAHYRLTTSSSALMSVAGKTVE